MPDHHTDTAAAHTALRRIIANGSGIPAAPIPNITPSITIGAGPGFYCTPQPDLTIRDGIDPLAPTPGPYTHLEVGLRGPLPPQLRPDWRTTDRPMFTPPPLVVQIRSCRIGWQYHIDGLTHSAGWRPTRTWAIRAGQATLTHWLKLQERHARPWQEVLTKRLTRHTTELDLRKRAMLHRYHHAQSDIAARLLPALRTAAAAVNGYTQATTPADPATDRRIVTDLFRELRLRHRPTTTHQGSRVCDWCSDLTRCSCDSDCIHSAVVQWPCPEIEAFERAAARLQDATLSSKLTDWASRHGFTIDKGTGDD